MDVLILLLLFVMIASIGAWSGITLYKNHKAFNKSDHEEKYIGVLVLHVDGREFIATTLELTQDILSKKDGDKVYMVVEVRQHSETNKG